MMSQESQIDVNLYLIISNEHKSEDDCGKDTWHAYNKFCKHDLQPIWINEKECSKIKSDKNYAFVIEKFKGDTFNKLRTFKCLMVGSKCLLFCFINGKSVPDETSSVFTTVMKGLCICASGLSPGGKDHVQKLIVNI